MSEGMLSVAARPPSQPLGKITSVCVLRVGIFHRNRKYLEELVDDGFVRVDRMSNSTAFPLGITLFDRRGERMLMNV